MTHSTSGRADVKTAASGLKQITTVQGIPMLAITYTVHLQPKFCALAYLKDEKLD